jgi:acyl-CoA reductase-like NAD-dependent aldehyde dehydrogenase
MTPISTPLEQLDASLGEIRRGQRAWASRTVRDRLAPVERFRRLVVAECDAISAAIARDVGKSCAEILGGEILPVADACWFLTREAPRLLRPRRIPTGQRPLWLWGQADTVHRVPRGVVGIIGTWNYPLLLNGVQILQALAAGNAVVWKPSEVVPHFSRVLENLLTQAGFPVDVVRVLPATREMGPVLIEAAIDHLVFTGSETVGRKIAARLGERLVSSTLELSGCDAQFVLEDADVPLAARAAWFGCTVNRGQTCIAVRRAFVHRSIYPAFCDLLRGMAASAGPMPLALPAQVRQADHLVAEAVAAGGRLLVERAEDANERCRPAVVIDARPEMALCREAAFAPVMAVLPYDTIEEALRMEAECPFALGASIFTRNPARADALASQLRTGMVTVNDMVVPTVHPATPFGGRGKSGWGVTQGAEGLLEMTVPRTVSVRGGTFRPHFDTIDQGKQATQEELLRGLLQGTHGATMAARLRGLWRVIRLAWRGL